MKFYSDSMTFDFIDMKSRYFFKQMEQERRDRREKSIFPMIPLTKSVRPEMSTWQS